MYFQLLLPQILWSWIIFLTSVKFELTELAILSLVDNCNKLIKKTVALCFNSTCIIIIDMHIYYSDFFKIISFA